MSVSDPRFAWTTFYQSIANKLLIYRHNRPALLAGLRDIAARVEGLGYLAEDTDAGLVRDICPFTTLGIFNRGISEHNRKLLAAELAALLGVQEPVPESFAGVPLLNNQNSWFFPPESQREVGHIDALWEVFAAALLWADNGSDAARSQFALAFDNAMGRHGVGWNLTFALYWIRPWFFLSLDKKSRDYISHQLHIPIAAHGPKKRCNAQDYLALMEQLHSRFSKEYCPVHSYPELSLEAVLYPVHFAELLAYEEPDELSLEVLPYAVENIVQEGCFLPEAELHRLLARLHSKKNLILQGPPGTGKTWLAKRLAFALMGQKDPHKLRAVQFHPNLSYEDFVRGWRPTGDGKLALVDGIFMQTIKAALQDKHAKFVLVIEEINRGNPAQIFGELLTLLEADKRNPQEALALCYAEADGQRVYIPENLYVIGTMNLADRSLALVDFALRRRFAFVNLQPNLGDAWRDWVVTQANLAADLADQIAQRVNALNQQIAQDPRLGTSFQIGHSYVTPSHRVADGAAWFAQVVSSEIIPLLEEYWFDAPDEVQRAAALLALDKV